MGTEHRREVDLGAPRPEPAAPPALAPGQAFASAMGNAAFTVLAESPSGPVLNRFRRDPTIPARTAPGDPMEQALAGTVQRRRHVVARRELSDLRDLGQAGEQEARELNRSQPLQTSTISNVSDANQARGLVTTIEAQDANLRAGSATNTIDPGALRDNVRAISALNDYLVLAGEQSRTLGGFQQALEQLRVDKGRLDAEVTHLQVTGQISQNPSSGEQMGNEMVRAAGGGTADQAGGALAGRGAGVAALQNDAQTAHNELQSASEAVGDAQYGATEAVHGYQQALNTFKSGLEPRSTEGGAALTTELNAVKAKIENMKKNLGYAVQAIQAGVSLIPGGSAAGQAVSAAGAVASQVSRAAPALQAAGIPSNAGEIQAAISEAWYNDELADVSNRLTAQGELVNQAQITAQLSAVRQAKTAFFRSFTAFETAKARYERARSSLRDSMNRLGTQADRAGGGGERYGIIAQLLADVDVFTTQCDTATRLGTQEQQAGGLANDARRTVTGTAQRDALVWWEPYRFFHISRGWVYHANWRPITLVSRNMGPGSAAGEQYGVNAGVERGLREVAALRQFGDGMRSRLGSAMGLSTGGAAPGAVAGPGATPGRGDRP